jgi:hypothetical protein
MEIHVYHHIFFDDRDTVQKIDKILQIVQAIKKQEGVQMKEFDDLVAVVNSQATVVDGLNTAVDGIVTKLNDVLSQLANTVDPVQVQALTAQAQGFIDALAADKDKLAAAVQNVPA